MRHLKHLNKYFGRYKWHFGLGILFVTISNIFGVLPPIMIRNAFEMVRSGIQTHWLFQNTGMAGAAAETLAYGLMLFVVIVLSLAFFKGLFMFFMRQTIIVMSRHIEYDLRNDIYSHYQTLDQAFYKSQSTGDLMSRVSEDVNRVRMYLGPAIMYALNTIVTFVVVITVMLRVNAELTLYVLLPLPILSLSIYYVNSIIHKKSESIQRQMSFLTTLAQQAYSGIRVIKSYVQEKAYGRFFAKEADQYREKALELAKVEALFFPLMLLLIGLSTILTVLIGGMQVIAGKITPGNIAEFVLYVNMLTWPVTALGWIASIIQRAAASQKRINEFMLTKPNIVDKGVMEREMKGQLTFKEVSFTYPGSETPALDKVSFQLIPGEKMAIIGRTGSGKSTVADLLARLYDPDSGVIEMDGIPLQNWKLTSLRSQIGYVPQDSFLFSDTIAHNVGFGVEDATEQQIKEMLQRAAVAGDVERLPKQLDTVIGERGVTLSGGQKQRLTIARAFLRNPRLVILDDCLSAVDAHTEHEILGQMDRMIAGRTAIIITHRIFTLLDFDKIIVLDEGKLVEQGRHDQLLALNGVYAELYRKQQEQVEEEL